MRLTPLIFAAAGLAACSANTMQPMQRSARAEDTIRRALAGKVAGRPIDCLPSYSRDNMEVVDDYTILFHDGGNRTFLQAPRGGCAPLGSGHYTLVTTLHGSSSLCRGDISQVVDLPSGMTVGSCAMDSFIPYTRPGR